MHTVRVTGAALAAHIRAAVTTEDRRRQEVIILGLMPGRGFFVFLHLLLHIGKEIDLVTTQTLAQDSTRRRTPMFVDNIESERVTIYK